MEYKDIYENNPVSTLEYGGFLERFVAFVIDGLILSLALGIFSKITGVYYNKGVMEVILSPGNLFVFLVVLAYFIYFETGDKQATIGKSLMNLKVIKQNGDKLNYADVTIRYIGKIISAFVLMLGYVIALFDGKNRALHDYMASTYVIKDEMK